MTIDNEDEARKLARVIVSDIKLYNAEKIAKGKELSDEIAEGRALFARRVDASFHPIFEEAIVRSKLAKRASDRAGPAPAQAKAPDPRPPPTPLARPPVPRPAPVPAERSGATPDESPILQPTERPTPANVAPPPLDIEVCVSEAEPGPEAEREPPGPEPVAKPEPPKSENTSPADLEPASPPASAREPAVEPTPQVAHASPSAPARRSRVTLFVVIGLAVVLLAAVVIVALR